MKTTLVYALSGVALLNMARADTLPALIDPNNPAKAEHNSTPQAPPATAPSLTVSVPQNKLTPDTLIKVDHIQFIGGTVYPLKELLQPFAPYAHKQVPLKTITGIVNDITLRYRADGYPLSYAWLPDNNFAGGTIKIVLVEGYVAHSDIKSNNPNIAERLKRLAAKIMAEKPLTQATFDRYTQLMTRTPGTTVDANAQLPQNIYGAAAMQAVSNQPHIWDISSTLDTRRNQNLAFVNGSLSNLTSYGDQLGVATLIPLDSSTRKSYLGLNYQQFLSDEGLMMQLKGSFYRDDPRDYSRLLNFTNGYLDSRQETTQYNGGATFSYPIILTGKQQLSVNGGMDYTDRRNDNNIRVIVNDETLGTVTQKTHVRYPALEFGMSGFQAFERASINGKLTLRQGVNAGSLADAAPIQGNDLSFTLWKSNIDAAWMVTDTWRLSTSMEGDWSDNDLPEPERVSFGAQRFGRGYQDGEASGDYGYGGQVELRYLHQRKESTWVATVQPYILADTAQTWFNSPGLPHQRLASVATGIMFGDNKHYSLTVEAARPVGDLPTDTHKRDWRYSLTLSWNFNNLH
ncbi:ShlB/FhaC/HecB family hemolysin secretion/activation protein [Kluyvera genomosp. 1]|uniref:ShlB/FhaC/HecB family hemolysin secretion/activation protein n=1 Tax=Kluyvera genomosp. 1 TaxID=2774053 RepID=UPI00068A01F0|nr:POTRA domain-containing protein [Kluyvera genomosp. 1]